ncbi:hypothetical protein [Photobacterium kishitanii]|uniref:Uncharacterized protein n=1 Tax=Photobacterium kishitanii TaxID=318456 RepID=A0A2T3KM37_9GAMM|nr:hypothetical protein [Photobacterium kishitanii]PSV00743.1 hypothetical protein C9J27_06265 [Photobacterium kishitanii]
MDLIERLSATKYTFTELPDGARKAIVQYEMRETGCLHLSLINLMLRRRIITLVEAEILQENVEKALAAIDEDTSCWNDALLLVDRLFLMLDSSEFTFSYLDISVEELVKHVSSFEDFKDFDAFHRDYVKSVPLDRSHPKSDMWSVILQDFDDYEPIWDGNNRFHCAIRDKRERISVILA